MKNYENIMSEYKDIEFKAHVELDDVLNKVTQETWEIIEAKQDWDLEEMYKEAGDTLVNVVSAAYELWIEPSFKRPYWKEVGFWKFIVDLWDWNTKIQGFRNRYSRQKETIETVTKSTNELIADILSFADPLKNPLEILENNKNKFLSRAWLYFDQINLKDYIKDVPNFPKQWIDFKDISPLLENREAMKNIVFEMAEKCKTADVITGLDARGFLFGEAVANLLNKPFIMIRKAWKLPGETIWMKYWLEYWKDEIELQIWTIKKWEKVAIIDDLLATGWTVEAATKLIEKAWAQVENITFAISLDDENLINMKSRQNLEKYNIESILKYN